MGYNITGIDIIYSSNFSIQITTYDALRKRYRTDGPSGSIFDDNWPTFSPFGNRARNFIARGRIRVGHFWWYGDGSGSREDELKKILASFDGDADLVLTWEGGDSHSGLRLRNHEVTEHRVVMRLGDERRDERG